MTASVRASINYTADNGIAPDYYFYEPDPSVKRNPPGTDPREVEIFNGWPLADRLSLDKEGFEIKPFPGTFADFDNDVAVKGAFYDQVISFVKLHTGARRVVIFDHTLRMRMSADLTQQTTTSRPTVQLVHADYTSKSAPQRVRDILPDEAEALLKNRVAFYNVWKPLYERVEELPLACCDVSTHPDEDHLKMDLKYLERTGEIFVSRYSPQHKWYYFPLMRPDQALLLKTYDSDTHRARFMAHSAFEDPTSPPDARKRESIEVRTMAFF